MKESSKLINRRKMLGVLGAVGVTGIAGLSGLGQNRERKMDNEKGNKEAKFKTIGVLGGIGPQATMEFETRVHEASQRLIPAQQNGGYPPMIVYYHRHPPVIVGENMLAKLPIQPDPRFLEAAKTIGAASDFLVITSNGVHALQAEIERVAGRKVLSMIDVTLAEIRRRGWKKVGVLGLGEPFVYTKPLEAMKIDYEIVDAVFREKLDGVIFKVMEGRTDEELVAVGQAAVTKLRAKKVDGIILGCTELPVLLRESLNDSDILNPTALIAEAAVKFAIA